MQGDEQVAKIKLIILSYALVDGLGSALQTHTVFQKLTQIGVTTIG